MKERKLVHDTVKSDSDPFFVIAGDLEAMRRGDLMTTKDVSFNLYQMSPADVAEGSIKVNEINFSADEVKRRKLDRPMDIATYAKDALEEYKDRLRTEDFNEKHRSGRGFDYTEPNIRQATEAVGMVVNAYESARKLAAAMSPPIGIGQGGHMETRETARSK